MRTFPHLHDAKNLVPLREARPKEALRHAFDIHDALEIGHDRSVTPMLHHRVHRVQLEIVAVYDRGMKDNLQHTCIIF